MTGHPRRWFARIWVVVLATLVAGCAADPEPRLREAGTQAARADLGAQVMVMVPARDAETIARVTRALLAEHDLAFVAQWPLGEVDLHCIVFRVGDAEVRSAVLDRLNRDPRVRLAQPMNTFELMRAPEPDPLSDLQRGLVEIAAQPVHALATGRGVQVAVIDSGVEGDHPDLESRIADWHDVVGDAYPGRGDGHGTAVAGVIAAAAGNGEGIVGVAPDAELVAIRACWETLDGGSGRCSSFTLARALNLALAARVDVVNLSLTGPEDPILSRLIAEADRRRVVVVGAVASGGDSRFPSSQPSVLAVADAEGAAVTGAQEKVLAAPGSRILTTLPAAAYGFRSGSSLATAHVTGVVALLRELDPALAPDGVRAALVAGARSAGRRPVVNACRSVETLVETDLRPGPDCPSSGNTPA